MLAEFSRLYKSGEGVNSKQQAVLLPWGRFNLCPVVKRMTTFIGLIGLLNSWKNAYHLVLTKFPQDKILVYEKLDSCFLLHLGRCWDSRACSLLLC